MISQTWKHLSKKGFTLLELLIVISIIAVLSVIIIVVINPAELLKKARDVQRISDLNSLKSAIGAYLASTSSPILAGSSNTACKSGAAGGTYSSGDYIYYSYPSDTPGSSISDATLDGGSGSVPSALQVTDANLYDVDGTGWIPVNLASMSGGSPISNLPVDPLNTIASVSGVVSTDLVYRYACNSSDTSFEINAVLESTAYTTDDNRMSKDGGNNDSYYEVGTNLNILGTGTGF